MDADPVDVATKIGLKKNRVRQEAAPEICRSTPRELILAGTFNGKTDWIFEIPRRVTIMERYPCAMTISPVAIPAAVPDRSTAR